MKYSTNYNMNKPELNEQYRLEHWNNNTDIIDTELKRNADNIETAETALQNAINEESSRATTAETALRNITDSTFKTALLNFCYPVGSLYWSSKSTNPSTLFGGTWVQIKDRFILASGDTYANGATGGSATVELTELQLPKHKHSFTPSGTVSSHKHELSDTDSSTNANDHTIFTGTSGDVSVSGANHTHSAYVEGSTTSTSITKFYGPRNKYGLLFTLNASTSRMYSKTNCEDSNLLENSGVLSMSGSFTPSGKVSGNTRSATPTFTGTAGTTELTGGGKEHNNMPPYIVKYCWERTA